jgi:hypothetical protein
MDMFRQIAPDGVVKKEEKPKNMSPAEALDEAQAGVKAPEEQELPDEFIQTQEEVEQTIAALDKMTTEEKMSGLQSMPAGHPEVSTSSSTEGACPFMSGGSR